MWIVICDYLADKTDTTPVQTSTFTVSDLDGKLVK